MDLNFFENDIFYQNFNINLNKIVWIYFLKKLKTFLKMFPRIFQEYSRNLSQKVVTKVIKKKANVSHVIPLHSVKAKQKLKTISQYICKLEKQISIKNILFYLFSSIQENISKVWFRTRACNYQIIMFFGKQLCLNLEF